MKFLIVFLFASTLTLSQGEHIYNNNFGFGINYNYSGNEIATGSGVTAGISIWGKLDFAFGYAISRTDVPFSSYDLESTSTLFQLAYNAKIKNRANLKLMLGYFKISSDLPYASGIEAKGVSIGLLVNYKMIDTEKFIIMPGIGIIYGFASTSSDIRGYSSTIDSRNLGLEINLVSQISRTLKIIFTPSLTIDLIGEENTSTPGISVGLLFNSIKSE